MSGRTSDKGGWVFLRSGEELKQQRKDLIILKTWFVLDKHSRKTDKARRELWFLFFSTQQNEKHNMKITIDLSLEKNKFCGLDFWKKKLSIEFLPTVLYSMFYNAVPSWSLPKIVLLGFIIYCLVIRLEYYWLQWVRTESRIR